MAKGTQTFAKQHPPQHRPEVLTRELPPKVEQSKSGASILCPFCAIPHPIHLGDQAPCGTSLRVTAVQAILPEKTVKKHNLSCLKCHEGGGEMVPFNQGYVHLHDCTPGTRMLVAAPRFSPVAKVVYKAPKWLHALSEKWLGKAEKVLEVDGEGKETGKVLGYFFLKADNHA